MSDPLLDAIENLSRFHREHEKFYASAPREQAVAAPAARRTLHALADRWSTASPSTAPALSPFAGADDLNDRRRAPARRRAVHGGRGRARRAHAT